MNVSRTGSVAGIMIKLKIKGPTLFFFFPFTNFELILEKAVNMAFF